MNGADPSDLPYENFPDDAEVRIFGGAILGLPNDRKMSFEGFFRVWKRCQTIKTILVECDDSKLEAVKAAIKAAGGKVL